MGRELHQIGANVRAGLCRQADEEVRLDLESVIGVADASVIEAVGADKTAKILEVFRGAVYGHKQAVEKAAASGSLSEFVETLKH